MTVVCGVERSIGTKFTHAYADLPIVACVGFVENVPILRWFVISSVDCVVDSDDLRGFVVNYETAEFSCMKGWIDQSFN